MTQFYKLFLLILSLFSATEALALYHTHAEIRAAAEQHVVERKEQFSGKSTITVGRLDSRLKLSQCDQPLKTFESPNGLKKGRSVVGIRCNGSKPWKIYVPVNIAIEQSVVTVRFPVAKGQLLNKDNLILSARDVSRLHRVFYSSKEPLIGLRAKRSIRSGKIVTPNMLEQQLLVKRGSMVEILSQHGSLKVRMKGKALSNGIKGERIKVKNNTSGREVTGEVISSGVILVHQ